MGMEIKLDMTQMAELERQIVAEVQPQVDAEVNAGVAAVEARMGGCGDVDAVRAALVAELTTRLGDGFHPGDDLWDVAEEIASGA